MILVIFKFFTCFAAFRLLAIATAGLAHCEDVSHLQSVNKISTTAHHDQMLHGNPPLADGRPLPGAVPRPVALPCLKYLSIPIHYQYFLVQSAHRMCGNERLWSIRVAFPRVEKRQRTQLKATARSESIMAASPLQRWVNRWVATSWV